jgi:hypothetical protein
MIPDFPQNKKIKIGLIEFPEMAKRIDLSF